VVLGHQQALDFWPDARKPLGDPKYGPVRASAKNFSIDGSRESRYSYIIRDDVSSFVTKLPGEEERWKTRASLIGKSIGG
jgi:hypothetical protein